MKMSTVSSVYAGAASPVASAAPATTAEIRSFARA